MSKYIYFHLLKNAIRHDKRRYKDNISSVKITEFNDFFTKHLTTVFIFQVKKGVFNGFKRRYDSATPCSKEQVHKNFMFHGKAYGEYLEYKI
jgi:hypothetical protein